MKDFFVVGIGIAAGSLQALQTFFRHTRPSDHVCYVIIRHHSPEFENKLEELLSQYTAITIHTVKEKVQLAPGRVYIPPSDYNLIIDDNRCLVPVDKESRGTVNLPIDLFFSSLAHNFREKAVGILLTGTDSSRGIWDIHEQGGVVMIEESQTATSGNVSGLAAYKGSPKEIAEELLKLTSYSPDATIQHKGSNKLKLQHMKEGFAGKPDPYISHLAAAFAPDSIFINNDFDIVYFHGNVHDYLQPYGKQIRANVLAVLHSEETAMLKEAIATAFREDQSVGLHDFSLTRKNKKQQVKLVLQKAQVSRQQLVRIDIYTDPANIQDINTLKDARRQLQISEERLEYAVQGTSDGIWDWSDLKQKKLWWSPKYYELLGLKDQEIESSFESLNKLIHPNDRQMYTNVLKKRLEEEGTHEVEFRVLHKTRGYRWYLSRGQAFRNEAGKPIRMAGSLSDIQDRKIAEFQHDHTYQMLKRANEYLDNIVFTVAHDLSSPVANLKSLIELFKTKVNDTDNPIVERIDLSVIKLEQTLRGLIQILDVHQTEGKSVAVSYFHELLNKLIREMETTIKEKQAAIQSSFHVKQIAYIHPFMESIMRNLLGNAIKYTKPGVPAKITIQTEKHKDFVLLTVADNGIGIDLDRFREKIFKPFERLSKKSTGQGIGLHLIKAIVEKNGGKVTVSSKLNVGTIFKVYLKPYA